ncbi:hypothetical protein U0035_08490 [Niabella yanshanensis]|uniref:Uncharacterized protein n=1 Tax=Niabella yanshanensis TaxID=577386 RepID=A0ABZ0WCU1_9BACT|nr:hypothetical protein [Niabella yanshanensis]WQD40180.1 hypothetical protein U0035_08490 [Niabella yanshanensis]
MDDKLKLLIEYFESEVSTLQQLIQEELDAEENYQAASWYQRGLSAAKSELRILHSFNEPFYSQKDRILQRITRFKQKLSEYKEGDENYLKFSTLVKFTEEEYEALSLQDLPPVPDPRPHLFEEAVDKVFKKEIKGVHLIINENSGFRFEIIRKRSQVTVTVPWWIKPKRAEKLDEYQLKRLAQFGFEVKKQPLRLVKSFSLRQKEAEADLKMFLARCYFEILNPHAIKNQGYIEYIH